MTTALAAVLLALVAQLGPAHAQTSPPVPPPPPKPIHLAIDTATLAGLPRVSIKATDEHGATSTYTGVSLRDLLVRAGAPNGEAVRGKAMMSYVVVGAGDNYHVLFVLPELDGSYTDHVVLIAETKDGAPFPAAIGPYRLITNFDKREARWVRQVTAVDLLNAPVP
jgi:hypothetical protein